MNKCQNILRIILAAILVLTISGFITFHQVIFRSLFSYLCVSKPFENASVLVIEGWLFDYMLNEAADEFKNGRYSYCIFTSKKKNSPQKTYNRITHEEVQKLIKWGVDSQQIRIIEISTNESQFTYRSSVAVKRWLQNNDAGINEFNVFTGGPHGRKTWTIYRRVFGKQYSVGILSSSIQHFDGEHWWRSRRGRSVVTRYFIGYFYALFWPFDKNLLR